MFFQEEFDKGGRFERKFVIEHQSSDHVIDVIKCHPACFSEIFFERKINNIYFDTYNLDFFHDNTDGNPKRRKFRLRWYDYEDGKQSSKPKLEIKVKSGLVGTKLTYNLPDIDLKSTNSFELKSIFQNMDLPGLVKNELARLEPKLYNSYRRIYFKSFDGKFRFTVDKDLRFYKLNGSLLPGDGYTARIDKTILELKYDMDYDMEVGQITSHIPYRLSKFSKYVEGIMFFNPVISF